MEGVDAGYLYLETPTMHMHTLKIALVEPAESFEPSYFTEVVLDRLDPAQHGTERGQIDGTPEDGDSFFDVEK